jgi:hypothetical protein
VDECKLLVVGAAPPSACRANTGPVFVSDGVYKNVVDTPGVAGRGLHSSTSQLYLSRLWSLKSQLASTPQLNLKPFCRCDL